MGLRQDVKRAQNGDEKAFVRVIKECEPTLYRAAKGILRNDNDCSDAIQETILKSYSSLHTLRQTRYFKTWLVRILINECYKILREHKRVVPFHTAKEPQYDAGIEGRLELREAMEHLPEKHRLIVILFYIEGFAIREIAEVLHISEGTVKTRLHRARAKLAESLKDEKEQVEGGDRHV